MHIKDDWLGKKMHSKDRSNLGVQRKMGRAFGPGNLERASQRVLESGSDSPENSNFPFLISWGKKLFKCPRLEELPWDKTQSLANEKQNSMESQETESKPRSKSLRSYWGDACTHSPGLKHVSKETKAASLSKMICTSGNSPRGKLVDC